MKRLIFALALILCPLTVQAQNVRMERSSYNTFTVGTLTVTLGKFANGTAAIPSIGFVNDQAGFYLQGANEIGVGYIGLSTPWIVFSAGSIKMRSDKSISWSNGVSAAGTNDTYLYREGVGNLGLRNSTNAQQFSVSGTWTDASNYERGFMKAGTTGLIIGHESAGTGSDREVRINSVSKNVAVFSGTVVTMTDETAVTVMSVTVPDNSMCQVTFEYGNIVVSASEYQGHDGTVSLLVGEDPDAADSYSCSVEEETEHVLASAGTLTDSWGCTAGATTTVAGNFNSTLDVAGSLTLNVTHSSGCVITIP